MARGCRVDGAGRDHKGSGGDEPDLGQARREHRGWFLLLKGYRWVGHEGERQREEGKSLRARRGRPEAHTPQRRGHRADDRARGGGLLLRGKIGRASCRERVSSPV